MFDDVPLSTFGIALASLALVLGGVAAGGAGAAAPAATDSPTATPAGEATFGSYSYVVAPGNATEMTVELSGTDTAEVRVGGPTKPYDANVTVTDGNDDGEVALVFDTGAAGDSGAYAAAADADSVTVQNQNGPTADLNGQNLPVTASVDGTETGVSNVLVRPPLDRSTPTPTATATATPTATDSPTPTDGGNGGDETASPTSSSSPGLGLTAGLIALAGAALLAARR